VKTVSTTGMIDKLAEYYDLPLIVTPVGFKHICREMLTRDVIIGGEESGGIGFAGHIPERDGILSALYLLEFMAKTGKGLGQLLDGLFSVIGPHFTRRIDITLPEAGDLEKALSMLSKISPAEIGGVKVKEISVLDGYKFFLENGDWLLFRISGTEPMIRIYAESGSDEKTLELLGEGRKLIGV
ncbi:MAG: phosphoglucomutase/phosphomannomutase family protein, partial [Candidatus Eremiobacteraeota bacterium]|nr:phosphoglucomutase/phosphomannomutase family protein [Candidatus Eremiobacteraeota bacterium]